MSTFAVTSSAVSSSAMSTFAVTSSAVSSSAMSTSAVTSSAVSSSALSIVVAPRPMLRVRRPSVTAFSSSSVRDRLVVVVRP